MTQDHSTQACAQNPIKDIQENKGHPLKAQCCAQYHREEGLPLGSSWVLWLWFNKCTIFNLQSLSEQLCSWRSVGV